MAIKGLTDLRNGGVLPTIGTVRKGAAKAGNKPGADLDSFRVTSKYAEVLKEFEAEYSKIGGLFPVGIGIILVHDSIEANFPTSMEAWDAKGLLRRCDGETQFLHLAGNKMSQTRLPCLGCDGGKDSCKPTGRLRFVVPRIRSRVGSFELETHSKWDLISISQCLQVMREILGSLTGVPMVLSREQRDITAPMGENRGRVTKSLINLRPHISVGESIARTIEARMMTRIAEIAGASDTHMLEASAEPESALPGEIVTVG
jgi:hypothetical protein